MLDSHLEIQNLGKKESQLHNGSTLPVVHLGRNTHLLPRCAPHFCPLHPPAAVPPSGGAWVLIVQSHQVSRNYNDCMHHIPMSALKCSAKEKEPLKLVSKYTNENSATIYANTLNQDVTVTSPSHHKRDQIKWNVTLCHEQSVTSQSVWIFTSPTVWTSNFALYTSVGWILYNMSGD